MLRCFEIAIFCGRDSNFLQKLPLPRENSWNWVGLTRLEIMHRPTTPRDSRKDRTLAWSHRRQLAKTWAEAGVWIQTLASRCSGKRNASQHAGNTFFFARMVLRFSDRNAPVENLHNFTSLICTTTTASTPSAHLRVCWRVIRRAKSVVDNTGKTFTNPWSECKFDSKYQSDLLI